MFERFTDRARRVVVLAQEEARMLYHNYIGTEHLLLGMLSESEGVAARSLEHLGISLEYARVQVEEVVGRGPQPPSSHLPFTPRAKYVLDLALRQALHLGHNYIGTEHLLLGLLDEHRRNPQGGIGVRVLEKLGINPTDLWQHVITTLGSSTQKSQLPLEPIQVTTPPVSESPVADGLTALLAQDDPELALRRITAITALLVCDEAVLAQVENLLNGTSG